MKRVNYFVFLLIGLFFTVNVYALDIKEITMNILVLENGDAKVTEKWIVKENKNTEIYKRYEYLGKSEISDFKVSLNGEDFTTIDNWDIDASFEEKKYKAGLNYIDNGVELCFGITKYGTNTYTMNYTISNFVVSTSDSDMIYWGLISSELDDKPEYAYIRIYSNFPYDTNWDVWGYGYYGGYAYVHSDNKYIELVKEDGLDDDEYMVALVKFPKGTFNTSLKLEDNFQHYLDMAEEGAIHYEDKISFFEVIEFIFSFLINIIIPFIIIVVAASKYNKYGTKKLKFSKDAKKLKDVPYFRNIPCKKDIFKAYWIACQYNLIKNSTDFLGALLLKWLKNKNIENVIVNSNKTKKDDKAVKLLNKEGLTDLEIEVFDMMLESSADGVLESYEFTKWCKKNYNKILKWFNKAIDSVTMDYVNLGLIAEETGTFGKTYLVSDRMKEEAMQMAGLKKFLEEFSNIKDRESIEVKLWEEYLMYAQIFGIAKKVAKEFKKLYPDIITDEYYDDVIFIHTISYRGVSAASNAKSQAEGYSSGGGGFSSGGGGGGSFGGGSFGGGGGSR